jgi:hypothetical protein
MFTDAEKQILPRPGVVNGLDRDHPFNVWTSTAPSMLLWQCTSARQEKYLREMSSELFEKVGLRIWEGFATGLNMSKPHFPTNTRHL